MPEIKNQFTGGKMNKDLDERLVPQGQYRDAMNIKVTTSDNSDVGTVQNILGNVNVSLPFRLTGNAKCVGSISDEKNDAFYWFIHESPTPSPSRITIFRDIIFEHKNNTITTVFVDRKNPLIPVASLSPSSGNIVLNASYPLLSIGDEIKISINGVEEPQALIIQSAPIVTATNTTINIGDYTAFSWASLAGNFTVGDIQVVPQNRKPVLSFTENMIVGINIIDDLLFFTDNITEPKKINIPLSIEGTVQTGNQHTLLINPGANITTASNIEVAEKHITVIRKAPRVAPCLKMVGQRNGNSFGVLSNDFNGVSRGQKLDLNIISYGVNPLNYQVGDILLIKQDTSDYPVTDGDIRVVVKAINAGVYTCSVISIKSNITVGFLSYGVDLDKSYEKLYQLKFPRFCFRWKYKDNEYSSFGPFSEPAFIPGAWDEDPLKISYLPNSGYNLGMENRLRELTIEQLIPLNIPEDVKQVDILYKESDSPNVYLVDEIKPSDQYWINDSYTIKQDTIKSVLPSNQLLRPWDNVPTRALAQEIIGNRIVYANYEQNYNVSQNAYDNFRANFSVSLQSRNSGDFKSIKSIRNYQFGVVYTDVYNRQTPVLTDTTGSLPVSKLDSSRSTMVEISSNTLPPDWATHQKFYVKETSSEYYNLSLDRYFDAEDGNIWLSFASNDRDKIDLETTLYLKKKYNSNEPETSLEQYKVIDVKNEAPEYIRTRRVLLGSAFNDTSTSPISNEIFTGGTAAPFNLPVVGETEFHIEADPLQNTLLENFHKKHNAPDPTNTPVAPPNPSSSGGGPSIDNPLFIKIRGIDTNNDTVQETNWYEVDNVAKTDLIDKKYIIKIKDKFGTDASFTNINDITDPNDMINLGDTNGMQLVLDVAQDIVQNRSVFQGRFFVKILIDSYINEAIVERGKFQSVQVLKTANFGYIKDFAEEDPDVGIWQPGDHQIAIGNFNSNGFAMSSAWTWDDTPPTNAFSIEAYWSHAVWQAIQRKLDDLPTPSRWVIDEAFAIGEEPLWTQNGDQYTQKHGRHSTIEESQSGSTNYSGYNTGNYNYSSSNHNINSLWTLNNGETIQYTGGLNHGSNTANYEYYTEGKGVTDYTIDLSYVGPGRRTSGSLSNQDKFMEPLFDASFWNSVSDSDFKIFFKSYWGLKWAFTNQSGFPIGDEFDEEAKEFALQLIPGNHLRFTNDPNKIVYEIKDVKVYYKLNYAEDDYSQRYPLVNTSNPGGPILSSNGERYWQNHAHFNQRTTYRLTLEAPNPGDKIGTNGSGQIVYNPLIAASGNPVTIASETENCPIEILSLNYINNGNDNDVEFPENPAVFETEPKENIDLDVFHEVSDTLPLELKGDVGYEFAPAGTNVTVLAPIDEPVNGFLVPGAETFTTRFNKGDYKVVSWNDNTVELSRPLASAGVNFTFNQQSLITFVFTRCDGSYTTATYTNWLTNPFVGNSMSVTPNVSSNIVGLGWHNCYAFGNGVESNRIRDTFNSVFIDKGPKVSTTLEEGYEQERRKYGLIYSGLYNSISGINNLNQFIQAEKITKEVNPTYGSIQKLHARNSDLVALCEDRILRILANKDAVFNADGNPQLTATNRVLGQTIPFSGEYGISKNPESFASESYRSYFTDKVRGKVIRLSKDGLTPISDYGMRDWFKDNLKLTTSLVGSYDDNEDQYNITLSGNVNTTVTYREDVKGWVSFKSFVPENAVSCVNEYYTFLDGQLWKHHSEGGGFNRNNFYNVYTESSFNPILNQSPEIVKSFNTLNYEGSKSRIVPNLIDDQYYNLAAKTGWYVDSIFTNKETGIVEEFIEKEGKWFNYIKGTPALHGVDGKEWNTATDANILINPDGSSSWDQASFAVQGLGIYNLIGCSDPTAVNFIGGDPSIIVDDGSCTYEIEGCMDINSVNYNPDATVNAGCKYLGCLDPNATNYLIFDATDSSTYTWVDANGVSHTQTSADITEDCGDLCCEIEIFGCVDSTAINFNPDANADGGGCIYCVDGCMDPTANNYDANATCDDGSCTYTPAPIIGCMDPNSISYNSLATTHDPLACGYAGCTNPLASNYGIFDANDDYQYTWSGDPSYVHNINSITQPCISCCEFSGCTDPLASNYNAINTEDDGSCVYPTTWSCRDGACFDTGGQNGDFSSLSDCLASLSNTCETSPSTGLPVQIGPPGSGLFITNSNVVSGGPGTLSSDEIFVDWMITNHPNAPIQQYYYENISPASLYYLSNLPANNCHTNNPNGGVYYRSQNYRIEFVQQGNPSPPYPNQSFETYNEVISWLNSNGCLAANNSMSSSQLDATLLNCYGTTSVPSGNTEYDHQMARFNGSGSSSPCQCHCNTGAQNMTGCTDPTQVAFWTLAMIDDGTSCGSISQANFILSNVPGQTGGCTDANALNYNASATVNDGTCNYSTPSAPPSTTPVVPPATSY